MNQQQQQQQAVSPEQFLFEQSERYEALRNARATADEGIAKMIRGYRQTIKSLVLEVKAKDEEIKQLEEKPKKAGKNEEA